MTAGPAIQRATRRAEGIEALPECEFLEVDRDAHSLVSKGECTQAGILLYIPLEGRSGLGVKGRDMAPHLPGTILVVDDEPSVVRALTGLLRRDGYSVSTASNGHHALTQLQERPYDVIVCDLHMPGLDGPAFYAILTCQYPALCQRVIFLTGDPGSAASMAFLTQCGRPWLRKPCPVATIRRAIQHVLQASPHAEA